MKKRCIVVLNAGSTSYKYAVYALDQDQQLPCLSRGAVDVSTAAGSQNNIGLQSNAITLTNPFSWIDAQRDTYPEYETCAVVHRVVHGGDKHAGPAIVSEDLLVELKALVPFVPLHQPKDLALIQVLRKDRPELMQIACFDTSFHLTQSKLTRMYGLPRRFNDQGLHKFGFHGLSYQYVAQTMHKRTGATGRMIVAHLGGGASICGMVDGVSVSSSMGISALDGLLMSTRCGSIDPGLVIYLIEHGGYSAPELNGLLHQESGLLGVSGISGDMRELIAHPSELAQQAVELFVMRAAREIAAIAADIGGMDTLVFTGGVGASQPLIRAAICKRLEWLDVMLDLALNMAEGDCCISHEKSVVDVHKLETNEELVMAMEARRLLPSS